MWDIAMNKEAMNSSARLRHRESVERNFSILYIFHFKKTILNFNFFEF